MANTATSISLDLQGLKCPLPGLRTRRALSRMGAGSVIEVTCTDPLAAIDIPALVQETGNALIESTSQDGILRFRIRKL